MDRIGLLRGPISLNLLLVIFLSGHTHGDTGLDSSGSRLLGAIAPSGPVLEPAQVDTIPAPAPHSDEERSILTVTGSAQVEAQPDRATIVFAVETEGPTAQEAGEANARSMTAVTAAIRAAGEGVPGLRVESSGYSVTPRYGSMEPDRSREIVGYTARNGVRTLIDDAGRVGELVDAALSAGANRISNLHFEVRDPDTYRHQALQQAVAKARADAEIIAAALGMRLGPALDVQGGAEMPSPRTLSFQAEPFMREMADASPTPVEAGLQTIPAEVRIRFRLENLP